VRRVRVLLGLVGAAVFGLALVILVSPGSAGLVPVERALAVTDSEYVLVAAFGVLAMVVVGLALLARGIGGIDQTTPPDPEEVYAVPHPGADFDEFIGGRISLGRLFGSEHDRIHGRLHESAAATIVRESNCTREEALRRLADGEWTDDRAAAAFLAEHRSPGVGSRALAAIRGESVFQRGARRTATAIAAYGGEKR
jgi:hypothetical protein